MRPQSLYPGSYRIESRIKGMPTKHHPRHSVSRESGQRCGGHRSQSKLSLWEVRRMAGFHWQQGKADGHLRVRTGHQCLCECRKVLNTSGEQESSVWDPAGGFRWGEWLHLSRVVEK